MTYQVCGSETVEAAGRTETRQPPCTPEQPISKEELESLSGQTIVIQFRSQKGKVEGKICVTESTYPDGKEMKGAEECKNMSPTAEQLEQMLANVENKRKTFCAEKKDGDDCKVGTLMAKGLK